MGRPAGSKNKPKRVLLNRAQVELAQREGIKLEQLAEDIKKSQRKPRAVKVKVDWEKLAKNLQAALASEIKENIAKNLARDIAKKVMFKKKHDKDADVHHFIGRVWVFTDEELKALLSEVM